MRGNSRMIHWLEEHVAQCSDAIQQLMSQTTDPALRERLSKLLLQIQSSVEKGKIVASLPNSLETTLFADPINTTPTANAYAHRSMMHISGSRRFEERPTFSQAPNATLATTELSAKPVQLLPSRRYVKSK